MSLRVILANVLVRLRTLSRERFAMFFTFLFPVILILVFGIIFTTQQRLPIELHVQDRDQTQASQQFIENLAGQGILTVTPISPHVEPHQHARQHELAFILIIPEGFERAHLNDSAPHDHTVSLTYVYHPHALALDRRDQFLHAMLSELNQRMLAAAPFIQPLEQPQFDQRRGFFNFFVPGIIAMAIMTASLYGTLHVNAELKQKGVLRKLAATPITRSEWLVSNITYQLVLALASTAAILLVSFLAFHVNLRVNLYLPLFILLTVITFVGMGMIIAPLARDAESASAAGNAVLFPMMFLSGTFFPIDLMPRFLQFIAYILPLYYINEGLRAAMLFVDHAATLHYTAVAAGFAVALFLGGALATRWGQFT